MSTLEVHVLPSESKQLAPAKTCGCVHKDQDTVGFGYAGRVFHAPIISATQGLRAILQRSGDDAATRYPEARVVKAIDELLGLDEIRLIVIATPNVSHYPIARECLLAGRDVVVDKPFTTTYAEAWELVNLAKKRC